MSIRSLKIVLVGFIALMALFYATQNVVNLGTVRAVVGAVLGMANHEYYTNAFGPAITNNILVWSAAWVIIALEYLAGVLAAMGVWQMWQARSADAAAFNASKKNALLGAGFGLIVWLGIFGAIGGSYFQMWQTELGSMSLEGATQFTIICAVVFLIVNSADE